MNKKIYYNNKFIGFDESIIQSSQNQTFKFYKKESDKMLKIIIEDFLNENNSDSIIMLNYDFEDVFNHLKKEFSYIEAGAENQVVKASLEQFDQLVAGSARMLFGIHHDATQLVFRQAVVVAQFLLFQQLQTELGFTAAQPARAVLAGRLRRSCIDLRDKPGRSTPRARRTLRRGPV